MDIVNFLIKRIYLIDILKKNDTVTFVVEEKFKNYSVVFDSISLKCDCQDYNHRKIVCKHIKFVLENMYRNEERKSKSCDNMEHFYRVFEIDIRNKINPEKYRTDRNPRFREYKIIEDNNYNGNCIICLSKLRKKIIRCKSCNKYYHEQCIYGWLRQGPACKCPNCRNQWL